MILALLTSCIGLGDGDGILKDRFNGRDDDTADPGVPACESAGFASGQTFTLPEGLSQLSPAWPYVGTYSYRRCQGEDYSYYGYSVSTLAGNSAPDLLLTRDDCQEDAGLGDASWRIYKNNGSSFNQTSDWTLPDGLSQLNPAWPTTAQASYRRCGGDDYSNYSYSVFDLDGDGWQDLVLMADECEDETLGDDHWQLYKGRDGGFTTNSTRWDMPEGFSQVDLSWYTTAQSSYRRCQGDDYSNFAYSMVDMDGDGLLDIVVTLDQCDDEALGESYWRVYFNTGSGFGSATSWDLPEGMSQLDQTWAYTAQTSYRRCQGDDYSYYSYSLMDITGDGLPDLVHTQDQCDDEALGDTYWRVYPGTGSGFGGQQRWDLPSGMSQLDQTWPYTAQTSYRRCQGEDYSYYSYSLLDITGDGAPDLVHTLDYCDQDDTTLGVDHWRIYHNNGSGFEPSVDWALPEGFSQVDYDWGYLGTYSYRRCDGEDYSYYAYSLFDLTGDGLLDLLRTRDDCQGNDLGDTYWEVYPGACAN